MKILKRLSIFMGILVSIPVLLLFISYIISPTHAGREIAENKGLKYPMVVAHRGASYLAPELTRPAFVLARDIGADYIETDIQRTKDGVLVNIHDDENLKRTSNISSIYPDRKNNPIGSFTYGELLNLDFGSWFNEKYPERGKNRYKGLKILTFDQFLEICESGKNKPGILIELKKPVKYPSIEKDIISVLKKRGWLDRDNRIVEVKNKNIDGNVVIGIGKHRVIFQSYDEKSLAVLKNLAPTVTRNYLVNEEMEKDYKGYEKLLEIAVDLDSEIGPSGYMAFPWYVGPAHSRNRFFFVYTLDKEWHFAMFSFFGIDGMITNRCDKYMEFIDRKLSVSPDLLLKQYE